MQGLALGTPGDPADAPLPPLRPDLHIQRVGTFRDGSPRFRIHDPLRNRYFELGLVDVDILYHWQAGESARAVAARMEEEGSLAVDPAEVMALRDLLARYQLVTAGDRAGFLALRDMWKRTQLHWFTWLLHHYLFFRVPLLRPDAWLVRWLPHARRLVSLPVRVALVVIGILTPVLLAREWNAYSEALAGLLTFDGLVASAVAASVAKVLHEGGHAFVARHHGVRVPVMGVAFLVMWPVLYTDTSDSWKLQDHRARFRIAAAGIATEMAIALVALFLWTLTPPGGLRSALFFLSTTSLLLTLSINASPFMRFDGYFLLSDALDFPNLHERAGAMARWWVRRELWGLERPAPEHHPRRMGRFLVAFALVTWAYRAVVFFGIALLVYFAFFKLLGIVLMLVELGWFLVAPVAREAGALWGLREHLRPRWARLALLLALAAGGLTLWAWTGESRATGLLMAAEETRLYAPSPARVLRVGVAPGQPVRPGDVLLELESPDLAFRAQANEVKLLRAQGELARIPATDVQRERSLVLQEELAQALSEQQAIREEAALLTVRANHAGRMVDMPADLQPGRWVHPRKLLGRVVGTGRAQVRAWVTGSQVRRLRAGDEVRFVPRLPEQPRVSGRVVRLDTTGSRLLPHPLLGGQHGGDLVASQNARGEWEMRETLYQVDIETDAPAPPLLLPGRLHVPTGPLDALVASVRQLLTVLVRESGF
ncbi:MAG TPA: HlyD family efflux transporter periplasmic adaptor subunit [Ramlibacter sp.]|jgi:putative peptide zinc metalloprotease protein|uniref:HlyD family efflux transporter periplasmic adaptor subunit n=1 Tax=Ramlibacter sp. TaxID=1917967 RepID=UPI002D75E639|nr:HlyD family efflux transporter periplasmic adaptor subunit [Ramlibacter sp.]HZY19743.1 HlyD family efflux transporter periplasmic adaptor subunit [Ramlibacter sp.]